ncbi:Dor1-like family-domain-containing protein [Naematelia encephala]|uniref:Conserved oligomeric Golgi complex subunit 8 n=1 Tax=Naematelia encephala TaxID=71784 RepID=A0A1Y2AYW1_9TREE|nr:Dor1-like family-domain-containing protein [Naematelia encephala]
MQEEIGKSGSMYWLMAGPSLVDLLLDAARDRRVLAPDFADTPSSSYIDHLVSLPLDKLLKEPSLISSEATTVETELVNLCYREYSTFISVHKCSAAVQSAFDDFEGSLGRLLNSVPSLEDECRSFAKSTQGIQTVRGRAALVLEHQDKLLDLLEIPHLMETCVRNGYYQEAMELAAHAEDLKKRCNVSLTDDVAKEVDGVVQLLLAQLLAILRDPVKLPTLVKAVTFLRRLGYFSEEELGLVFLTSRLHNFRVQLSTVERERGEPVRYVRRYIDLFREHVYDIISQFTAIFGESQHLSSFAAQCVSDLAQLITTYIPRISSDAASLSSILVQLGYCALSFSRVGLDFSLLIEEPFQQAVLSTYVQAVSSAATQLATTLKTAVKNATPAAEVLVDDVSALPSAGIDISESGQPPPSLSHFPALAVFVNAHMSALNALRLLAPSTLLGKLGSAQAAALVTANSAVLQYLKQVDMEIVNGSRPRHARTPSSPRAHLLRRNSETLLAPEIRAAKRRETQRACIAFAEAWRGVIVLLHNGLYSGIFEQIEPLINLAELDLWLDQQVPTGTRRISELSLVEEMISGSGKAAPEDRREQEPRTPPRTPPRPAVQLQNFPQSSQSPDDISPPSTALENPIDSMFAATSNLNSDTTNQAAEASPDVGQNLTELDASPTGMQVIDNSRPAVDDQVQSVEEVLELSAEEAAVEISTEDGSPAVEGIMGDGEHESGDTGGEVNDSEPSRPPSPGKSKRKKKKKSKK